MGGGDRGEASPQIFKLPHCDCAVVVIVLTCGLINVASPPTKIPTVHRTLIVIHAIAGCMLCLSIAGMYCSGWVKRGPVGVIVTTMNDAFETAEVIANDISEGEWSHAMRCVTYFMHGRVFW